MTKSPSPFTFFPNMINSVTFLLLILPLTTSLQFTKRLLAETVSYAQQGYDWTGTCAEGQQQSPIDIDSVSGSCDNSMVMDLSFTSGNQTLNFTDEGVTLRANWTNSTLYATDVDGILTGYQSLQMHFHAPSEHMIEGERYPLELHILHKITDQFASKGVQTRPLAVVGILFEVDDTAGNNTFLQALNLSSNIGKAVKVDMDTVLRKKMASPMSYFTYKGSLTAPLCNETVNWYVIETPLKITTSQLAIFTSKYAGNASFAGGYGNSRAVQDLNDRVVKRGGVECEEQFVYFFSFIILFVFVNYFVFKLL